MQVMAESWEMMAELSQQLHSVHVKTKEIITDLPGIHSFCVTGFQDYRHKQKQVIAQNSANLRRVW